MKKSITYAQVGDNYSTKDPIKKLAQSAAKNTARNLKKYGFEEYGIIPKGISYKQEFIDQIYMYKEI